jgi:hypothetical protein
VLTGSASDVRISRGATEGFHWLVGSADASMPLRIEVRLPPRDQARELEVHRAIEEAGRVCSSDEKWTISVLEDVSSDDWLLMATGDEKADVAPEWAFVGFDQVRDERRCTYARVLRRREREADALRDLLTRFLGVASAAAHQRSA